MRKNIDKSHSYENHNKHEEEDKTEEHCYDLVFLHIVVGEEIIALFAEYVRGW